MQYKKRSNEVKLQQRLHWLRTLKINSVSHSFWSPVGVFGAVRETANINEKSSSIFKINKLIGSSLGNSPSFVHCAKYTGFVNTFYCFQFHWIHKSKSIKLLGMCTLYYTVARSNFIQIYFVVLELNLCCFLYQF